MKVKVLKSFKDKHTKALHIENTELTISKERYEELNSTSLGIFVKEIKEDGILTDYADKYLLTEAQLSSYSKKELVEFAKDKGIELDIKLAKTKMIEQLLIK